MSRLSELIAELCPDGVKYMRFDEACTLKARIGWQRLTKSEQMPTGEYMLITGTDFTDKHTIDFDHCCYVSKDRFDQDLNIQVRNGDLLVTKDGTLGKVAIVEGLDMPATLNGGVFVVRDKTGLFDHRFIMHYLLSDHFRRLMLMQSTGSTISHLTQKLFSRLKLPVPPLPVQEEIVRILDSFSSLEAELEAELEARRKQYAHYRDELLKFEREGESRERERVEYKALCVVLVSLPKGTLARGQLLSDGLYPVMNSGRDFYGWYDSKNNSGNAITIAARGEYAGYVNYIERDFWAGGLCYPYRSANEEYALTKYVYHVLKNDEQHMMDSLVARGSIPALNKKDLEKLRIPVPPLEEQRRIVSILDRFDKLTNDLSSGLPAEIEARHKQYEYYRDRLLSFNELAT